MGKVEDQIIADCGWILGQDPDKVLLIVSRVVKQEDLLAPPRQYFIKRLDEAKTFIKPIPDAIRQGGLATNHIQDIQTLLSKLKGQVNRVADYMPNSQGARDQPEKAALMVVNNFASEVGKIIEEHTATMAYVRSRFSDEAVQRVNSAVTNAEEKLKQLNTEAAEIQKKVLASEERHKQLLDLIQKQGASRVVTLQKTVWDGYRENLQGGKIWWFWSTWIAVAVLMILALIVFLKWPVAAEASTAQILEHVVFRLVMLGAVTFVLGWSAKNYSAIKHNEIVFIHKSGATQALPELVASTNDPAASLEIVKILAQAVATMPCSGYGKESGTESPSINITSPLSAAMDNLKQSNQG